MYKHYKLNSIASNYHSVRLNGSKAKLL